MPADNFHTARAKSLLAHYLKFGLEAAGLRWDGDNRSEVADIVDSIIDAVQPAQPSTISNQQSSINNSTAQPDALTRIADALERIAAQSDWIELSDCWVRRGDIYRVDTGYQQNLFFYARYQEGAFAHGRELGDVLAALGIDNDR